MAPLLVRTHMEPPMTDEHCGAWWAIMSMLAEIMLVGVGIGLVVWVVRRLQYL